MAGVRIVIEFARFDFSRAWTLWSLVSWDVTMCSGVSESGRFDKTFSLQALMSAEAGTSERLKIKLLHS